MAARVSRSSFAQQNKVRPDRYRCQQSSQTTREREKNNPKPITQNIALHVDPKGPLFILSHFLHEQRIRQGYWALRPWEPCLGLAPSSCICGVTGDVVALAGVGVILGVVFARVAAITRRIRVCLNAVGFIMRSNIAGAPA